MEPADCVCCSNPEQIGRYAGLPSCFPCYETGRLRDWLKQNNALDWPNHPTTNNEEIDAD